MIPLASDLLPFPGADAVGRPFGVASRQTGFSSSGRIVIVGPIHRKCPEVVVVAVDKIAERCKQATESLSSDRSRENDEKDALALGQLRGAQTITESGGASIQVHHVSSFVCSPCSYPLVF